MINLSNNNNNKKTGLAVCVWQEMAHSLVQISLLNKLCFTSEPCPSQKMAVVKFHRLAHLPLHPTSIPSRSVPQLSSYIRTREAKRHRGLINRQHLGSSFPSCLPPPPPTPPTLPCPAFPLIFIQQTMRRPVGRVAYFDSERYSESIILPVRKNYILIARIKQGQVGVWEPYHTRRQNHTLLKYGENTLAHCSQLSAHLLAIPPYLLYGKAMKLGRAWEQNNIRRQTSIHPI